MERLSHWKQVWKEDLGKVESPFFAVARVRSNLREGGDLWGAAALLKSCGLNTSRNLTEVQIARVLCSLEQGQWMLMRRRPVLPIDPKRYWYAKLCRSRVDERYWRGYNGPGKWKTLKIEMNKAVTSMAFIANFLTSRGDEGRVFLSSGKDYANTARTVTQQWVALRGDESEIARLSAIHPYGAVRKVTQYYVEADDHWSVTGASWHWRPVTADESYEFREE
ncbi:hypothetical protein [Pseudomonas sp. NY15354]|uniref:hypothetical protein n=1 Tax=Pseudomonas sp. NY15354 TaxID=3400351 RepID=UPI003A879130